MNFKTESKTTIPPVKPTINRRQARGVCASRFGEKGFFFLSEETPGVLHITVPFPDAYIGDEEWLDAYTKMKEANK